MSPLFFNVAQLLKEGVGGVREQSLDGELRDIDETYPTPLRIRGRVLLVRIPRGVLVKGPAEFKATQTCRRCLETAESTVRLDLEEEFIALIDIETGLSLPLQDDDDRDLVIDEHHILDLTQILRQYVIIASSNSGLCQPSCKGLCPNCGQNRNLGPCNCELARTDPRLAVLSKLLESRTDSESSDERNNG